MTKELTLIRVSVSTGLVWLERALSRCVRKDLSPPGYSTLYRHGLYVVTQAVILSFFKYVYLSGINII